MKSPTINNLQSKIKNRQSKVCLIGLGSNLGTPRETLREATVLLSSLRSTAVVAESQLYTTTPMGEHAGDEFLNSVVAIKTALFPLELLEQLQGIEAELGRVRGQHWGPRSIDLDMLSYGNEIVEHPRLSVPHSGLWYRRFVLDPLCEIASDWRHPLLNETGSQLLLRLQQRPLAVCCLGTENEAQPVKGAIAAEFGSLVRTVSAGQNPDITLCPVTTRKSTFSARLVRLPEQNAPRLAVECLRAALDTPRLLSR